MSCLNYDAEAEYHFTLSAMVDLIRQYGYCNVINDLDELIAEQVDRNVLNLNADGVPLMFEEQN